MTRRRTPAKRIPRAGKPHITRIYDRSLKRWRWGERHSLTTPLTLVLQAMWWSHYRNLPNIYEPLYAP